VMATMTVVTMKRKRIANGHFSVMIAKYGKISFMKEKFVMGKTTVEIMQMKISALRIQLLITKDICLYVKVIHKRQSRVCDGKKDCTNGDDEKDCDGNLSESIYSELLKLGPLPLLQNHEKGCMPGMYRCKGPATEPHECIFGFYVCNGVHDCPERDDERNCNGCEWPRCSL